MLSGVSVMLVAAVMIVEVVVLGEVGSSGSPVPGSIASTSSAGTVGREEDGVWGSLKGASDADVDVGGVGDKGG